MSKVNAEPHYVRVINVGRRFGRGFERLESTPPLQKAIAWFLAILLGIPLALILGFVILSLIGVAIVMGLVSWLMGRTPAKPNAWSITQGTQPTAPGEGRENVRVVRNERSP